MRKIITKQKNIALSLFLVIFLLVPMSVSAKTHDFTMNAYDFDITANDWEGDGSEDPIANGASLQPGQIFRIDLYYSPGDQPETSMQVGIAYDPDVLTPIHDPESDEIFYDSDMSTTYNGGIWPAKGTTGTKKNQTDWLVEANDDVEDKMVKLLVYDNMLERPLQNEGVLTSIYFKVNEDVTSGTKLKLSIDEAYTRVVGGLPKTCGSIEFVADSELNDDVSLSSLILTGNNGLTYITNPAFTAGTPTRIFNAIVPNSVSSITVVAVPTDTNADIVSGSGSTSLNIGDNSFNLVVQSQTGTQEIYTINIKRLSNDATLKTLTLSGVSLDYALSGSVFIYTATVPYTTTSTTVAATVNDANATIVSGTGSWDLSNYGTTVNTKKITVNAEDCNTTYASVPGNACTAVDYTLNVTRNAPSGDNTLSDLKVDGTTVPGFSPNTTTYTLTSVANSKTSVNITAVSSDTKATITGTGTKNLSVGDNTLTVKVKAEDGTEKSYDINIRRLSNNANLATLSVTSTPQGILTPNFVPTFYNYYTYTYDSTVTSINVSATLEDSNASIVSGTGSYSSSDTSANVVTTAEDGTTKTYVINFSRNQSSDNNLKSLSIDGYSLNETFSPSTTLYTATVPGTVSQINVSAVANDSNATITGDGSHNLSYGPNTIQIRVTAENGAQKDYTLTITRSKKDISLLSDLKVDSTTVTGFNENTLSYNMTVPFNKSSVTVTATAKDSDATVDGTGSVNLSTGLNQIPVTVTAQDGSKTIYNLNITREKSNNNYLSSLVLAEKSFAFNKTQNTYNVTVGYEVTTATITATAEYADATASVSGPNFLSVGLNTYTITVTAENGDINTYTLNITREQSNNTYLQDLTVMHNSTNYLSGFNKETLEYNITVDNEIDNVDINAVLEDTLNQSVTGTGNKVLSAGLNNFEIKVTAASGSTKIYKINITRSLNTNNNLKTLEVVGQTLSPSFSAGTTTYTVIVDATVSTVVLQATPEVSSSTVVGTGTKTLQTGVNTFNIDVTSEDNKTKTYVVIITKKASNDSSLSSLSLTGGSLNETFQKTLLNYTATVPNNITQVTVNATATSAAAKSVTGTGVVNLTTGDNTVNVVVTAEDNTTTTYTIVITRAKSTNANLSDITLSGGYTLNETFNKNTITYTATVPNNVSTIKLVGVKEDATATVTGDGDITLSTGNNPVNIVVTAEDGTTKKTYTVNITRKLSSNANLKGLSSTDGAISPAFNKNTKDYTLTVPFEVENATINAIVDDSNANVSISGNTNLKVGTNNVVITVTAEDGTTNSYNLVVTRQPSSNNYLSDLKVIDEAGTNYIAVFNKTTLTYSFTVANSIDEVTISATPEDTTTIVTGTGKKNLSVGSNSFIVKSTSADGTPRDYIINIEREKNANAKLKSLSVSSQKIVPDFNPDTTTYSLTVDNTVTNIQINAEAAETTSTVTGAGQKQLSTGLNIFAIEVTAESGAKNVYTIVISKAASSNNSLASLLADQPFLPSFDKATLNYTTTVANNIDKINVQAVAEDPNATVTGNGDHALSVGNNQVEITVTAEDNTFRIYTISVYREASDNNYLSDLKVNGTTVTGFSRAVTNYSMTVDNNITQANVSAVVEDSTASVQGAGITYLSTSSNIINIVVTAQNGDVRTYTIDITRKKSSNNQLVLLSSLEGSLSPTFSKEVNDYTMQVPYEVTSLTLTTTVEDANAIVTIDGNADFEVGSNNTVSIKVIAEDGSENIYHIQVTRQLQASNFLTDLTVTSSAGNTYNLNPSFNKNTLNYTISIPEDDNDLIIGGTQEDNSSSVTGFGNIDVTAFPYIHQVTVTSASGIDRTYTLTIEKQKSSNTDLKGIAVSEGTLSPAFSPNITDYVVNVSAAVNVIDIGVTLDKGQSIAGDGTINLNYGNNTVSLVVTAEDGSIKTYTVVVVRDQDSLATLSNIQVTNGTLLPAFKSEVTDYIAYVGQDATSLTITPTLSDILSQMSISLNDGVYQNINDITITDFDPENIVKIKVDGTNQTIIYTVVVMKQSLEKITSDTYGHDISDGMIKTVVIDTKPDELKDQLDNENSKLKIYESDATTEYTGDNVGTGMIVKLIENDVVLDWKVIVVKGDTDGNGIIDAIDALKVVNHIIESETLSGPYLLAANTLEDDTINAIDALKIVNHIIGNMSLF